MGCWGFVFANVEVMLFDKGGVIDQKGFVARYRSVAASVSDAKKRVREAVALDGGWVASFGAVSVEAGSGEPGCRRIGRPSYF